MSVTFFVPGIPAPKGSMKAFKTPNMKFPVLKNDNPRTKPWQAQVALAASHLSLLDGAVELRVELFFPRPKKHFYTGRRSGVLRVDAPKRPTGLTQGDWDKHGRTVSDALTGIAYVDDSQVVSGAVSKWWSHGGQAPGARVTVASLEQESGW